jgi:NAD(P)-dependent dehydrogenase (short-subunit alcohol dehydrogenase family)
MLAALEEKTRGISRLQGKIAVVVGAATGHGRASAIRLADEGARVHVVDLEADAVGDLANYISGRGGDVRGHCAQLDDLAQLQAVASAVAAETDVLHVLVNHHLCLEWGTFEEVDMDIYAKVVHYNLVGPAASTKAFLPLLKAAQGSSIIHLGSIDGLFGNPLSVAYSASKGGLGPLTHIMAREFAPFEVRVNSIASGQTNQVRAADMDSGNYTDSAASIAATATSPGGTALYPGNWYLEQLSHATPLKRNGPPEEWAGTVCFLASEDSNYVTGQVLVVDCGRTGLTPGTFPWLSPTTR